jgi:hypothetical protein
LGIGANTAIFSVVNGVLLSRLPFPNADRIVVMFQEKQNFAKGSISYPNFLDWQGENRSFEAMALYRWGDGTMTGIGEPEDVSAHGSRLRFFLSSTSHRSSAATSLPMKTVAARTPPR